MTRTGKIIDKILRGTSDSNIGFEEMRHVLAALGFDERIRGDHHIFVRHDVEEILNIQPRGDMAKPYQVRQVRAVILQYRLGDYDE